MEKPELIVVDTDIKSVVVDYYDKNGLPQSDMIKGNLTISIDRFGALFIHHDIHIHRIFFNPILLRGPDENGG